MPLAFNHLLNDLRELVPQKYLSKAREEFKHNAARNLLLATELGKVIETLEGEGVQTVAYKGPALALQAYGDLKLRSFVDLDLLVRLDDEERAGRVLRRLGYAPHLSLTRAQEFMLARTECDRVYLREGRNLVLELHWAVVPPFFSFPLKTEHVIETSARIELCGRVLKVPAPETLLLLLCINGAKDLWASLENVCALRELIGRSDFNWAKSFAIAKETGAERVLKLGLSLARDALGASLPEEAVDFAASDRTASKLAYKAHKRLTSSEFEEAGLLEKTLFRVRARERTGDKIKYLWRKAFTPTYRDCRAELPASLTFAYYFLRPLRLIRDAFTIRRKPSTVKPFS